MKTKIDSKMEKGAIAKVPMGGNSAIKAEGDCPEYSVIGLDLNGVARDGLKPKGA